MGYQDIQSMSALVQKVDEERKNLVKDPDHYSRILHLELLAQHMKIHKTMAEYFPDAAEASFAKKTYQAIKSAVRDNLKEVPECDHNALNDTRKSLRMSLALKYTMQKKSQLQGHLLEAGEPEKKKAFGLFIPASILLLVGAVLFCVGQTVFGIAGVVAGVIPGIIGSISFRKGRQLQEAAQRALSSEAKRLQDELAKLGGRKQAQAEAVLKEAETKVNDFARKHIGFKQAMKDWKL